MKILSGIDCGVGEVVSVTFDGTQWSYSWSTTTFHPCSFCSEPATTADEKRGWHVCNRGSCNFAAEVQRERISNCLVDCEETRRDALTWAKERMNA